jgi:hypothetical protein
MAGSKSVAKGSLPNRSDTDTQAETAPGTVTASQPCIGIVSNRAYRSCVQAAGDRPEALSPCSSAPSQMIANASEPTPFPVGSTSVSVTAVAIAASAALPPRASIARPACAASGCDVATMLSARTAERREG